ncbi:hypothetical protein ALDI51_32630 [Alicycliphilus denitrificans]|uniref:DUF2894 domain-containing protein n=1 Tax=Alicycliphilus denitrificans TaxID=179636 RepID=UPI0019167F68|nr:DUF2894 domain-containing protein [Alicycliphilus denitrificans]MBN9575872.1 DUF2894 domain-containing protein [Alicycliphilus denitrificans]BCN39944.1 hypothetical protein ALDI51_32630 [Alicycliphilus denitrificans]
MNPVRSIFMEALARRAAAQTGQARRLLDARLAALMAACGQSSGVGEPPVAAAPAARPQGALGALARELARGHGDAAPPEGAAIEQRELHTLRRFRATWTRLSAEERLRQALAQVPPQAGPLNSHHLVHRALVLMRETSPEYLQRFVPYVDALLALDQMQAPPPPAPAPVRSRRAAASRAAVRRSRS